MKESVKEIDWALDDLDDEDTLKDKYLSFHIAGDGYGIEIRHVTEIIGVQKITEVPNTPDYILGIINLRGTVIPVIDVRIRLNAARKEFDDRTCVIVVNMGDDTVVGLLVDEVREVVEIPENMVEPPPKVRKGEASRYIQGIGKAEGEVWIILGVRELLFDDDGEEPGDAA
ncbi:MAG: chemotaxis protein CheW [Candidatus Nitrospinota bacterium M3_3B_026]